MAYRRRTLTGAIRRCLRTFPAVLVTGPRQAGKTTLLRTEFGRSHEYVSLDRPDVRARALADPVAFLAGLAAPVILDEIQRAPILLEYVKHAIDEDRRPGRWLITGSQSFPLMKGVSESLAGRVAILTLDPLSVQEATGRPPARSVDAVVEAVFGGGVGSRSARSGRSSPDLAEWIMRGGYPEIRLVRRVDRQAWFGSYVQTYLERDVRDLVQVGDLNAFARFLSLCAARTALPLNMSDIARDLGHSVPTVHRWLSVLEASRVIHLLQPWHRNLGKRILKAPRLIFLDPGLAAFLQGHHSGEALVRGPSFGALAETAVAAEWIKLFHEHGEEPTVYYWRSASGLEVDLLIERDARLHALEVKATATPVPRHAEGLARWADLAGGDVRAAVACRVDAPMPLAPGIRAVPWHLAWTSPARRARA